MAHQSSYQNHKQQQQTANVPGVPLQDQDQFSVSLCDSTLPLILSALHTSSSTPTTISSPTETCTHEAETKIYHLSLDSFLLLLQQYLESKQQKQEQNEVDHMRYRIEMLLQTDIHEQRELLIHQQAELQKHQGLNKLVHGVLTSVNNDQHTATVESDQNLLLAQQIQMVERHVSQLHLLSREQLMARQILRKEQLYQQDCQRKKLKELERRQFHQTVEKQMEMLRQLEESWNLRNKHERFLLIETQNQESARVNCNHEMQLSKLLENQLQETMELFIEHGPGLNQNIH